MVGSMKEGGRGGVRCVTFIGTGTESLGRVEGYLIILSLAPLSLCRTNLVKNPMTDVE